MMTALYRNIAFHNKIADFSYFNDLGVKSYILLICRIPLLWISGHPVAKCDPLLRRSNMTPEVARRATQVPNTFLHILHSFDMYLHFNIINHHKECEECKLIKHKTCKNMRILC